MQINHTFISKYEKSYKSKTKNRNIKYVFWEKESIPKYVEKQ